MSKLSEKVVREIAAIVAKENGAEAPSSRLNGIVLLQKYCFIMTIPSDRKNAQGRREDKALSLGMFIKEQKTH